MEISLLSLFTDFKYTFHPFLTWFRFFWIKQEASLKVCSTNFSFWVPDLCGLLYQASLTCPGIFLQESCTHSLLKQVMNSGFCHFGRLIILLSHSSTWPMWLPTSDPPRVLRILSQEHSLHDFLHQVRVLNVA